MPANDLATAVVQRLLVADADLDPDIVTRLTRLLFERRRDLVVHTPLAGFISAPDQAVGTFIPVHDGAQRYYDRDRPSFFQENAEPIALILTLMLLAGSGALQLTSQGKKRRIDRYNNDVLTLYADARGLTEAAGLRACRERLMTILGRVVDDAEEGRITEEGFNLFSFTWSAVNDRFGDRLAGFAAGEDDVRG